MIKSYLTLIIRNLNRNKVYTFINVIGLSIGIAAIVWAYQTYRFSFSFDDFQPDKEHIFRGVVYRDGSDGLKGVFPLPLCAAAKTDFASIQKVVRWDSRGADIKGDQSEPFSQQVHFTDPGFFELFSFPLVAGSNDLTNKNAVLITEEMSKKFFGALNPIGRPLLLYAGEKTTLPLTVTGVLKDPPLNSSIRFNFITHFDNQKVNDTAFVKADDWKWFLDAAFFKLNNPADAPRLAQDFKKYLPIQNAAREDWKITGFHLQPMTKVADSDDMGSNALYNRPDNSAAYGPLVLALLVFISACLNFANTTVARSNRRLKEIGVRKVMGGTRDQLVRQILLECAAVVFAAILLSMLINVWWLPKFNEMFTGISVGANYLRDRTLLVFLLIVLVGATLLAGAYPAFYISRFNAARIFKGSVKFGGNNLFSRVLLGLQVMISVITIISGIAFSRNAVFQKNYDYGYDRENLMGISFSDQSKFDAVQNAVRQLPGVEAVAGTRHHLGFGYRTMSASTEGAKKEVNYLEVGDDYLNVMKLETIAGRTFEANREVDYNNSLLINQKMAGLFGWKPEEAVGKQIRIDTIQYTVIGALRDFHSDNLFDPLEPAAIRLVKADKYGNLIIRTKPGELNSVYDQVKALWAGFYPYKPFRGFYQDEVAANAYKTTSSIASIFTWFAVVAVLLTATGFFALIALTVLKKMKEIAVRKVVGARPAQIIALVNRGYVLIFGIAAIAGCFAGQALTKLLMDAIFKVNAGVAPDILALSIVLLLATIALTSWFKVRQAIRANPAEVLKAE